jgi:hypothetical protein
MGEAEIEGWEKMSGEGGAKLFLCKFGIRLELYIKL